MKYKFHPFLYLPGKQLVHWKCHLSFFLLFDQIRPPAGLTVAIPLSPCPPVLHSPAVTSVTGILFPLWPVYPNHDRDGHLVRRTFDDSSHLDRRDVFLDLPQHGTIIPDDLSGTTGTVIGPWPRGPILVR